VWISCSQDGPQGSQHLIRFSVGHFAWQFFRSNLGKCMGKSRHNQSSSVLDFTYEIDP
jgi:hypothetical protein